MKILAQSQSSLVKPNQACSNLIKG